MSEDYKLYDNYQFRKLPPPLLKCLNINIKLTAKGVNLRGATNIYDLYFQHFAHEPVEADVENIDYSQFAAQTALVIAFQDTKNYISTLDWLQFFPKLQYLDCSYSQLTSVAGIAHCPDLQILLCQDSRIMDISDILHCPKLHTLNCSYNQITDSTPLLSHPNLFKVNAQGNQIIKIPLPIPIYDDSQTKEAYYQKLPNPLKFELTKYCQEQGVFQPSEHDFVVPYSIIKTIKNITVSCLTNALIALHSLEWLVIFDDLHSLDCSDNQISDLSPLKYCPNLQRLICNYNKIKDLSPVNALTQLNTLHFDSNPLTSIYNLSIFSQLTDISYRYNKLDKRSEILLSYLHAQFYSRDLSDSIKRLLTNREKTLLLMNYHFVLAEKKLPMNSDWLNINQLFNRDISNKLFDLAKIPNTFYISKLKQLNLNNYKSEPLTNLFFLQGLSYLEDLDCCFNQLPNFEGLEQAIELRQLDAAFNALTSLQGLQNCHKLQSLNLQNNPISDLSLLAHCKNLRVIHLNHTPIEHLHDLDELHDLAFLYIGDTKISADEISRFARLHPDCIIDNSL